MRHRRVNGVDNLKRLRELAASKLKELAGLGESNGQAYEANDWDTPVVEPSKDSSDWDNKLAQLVSANVPAKPKRAVNSAKREAYEKQKKADMYAELAKIYGYTKFRTGQYELISSILDGRDVLGVLPTGGGKITVLPAAHPHDPRHGPRHHTAHLAHARPSRATQQARLPSSLHQLTNEPS